MLYLHKHIYIYTYIYIYRERERERERKREREIQNLEYKSWNGREIKGGDKEGKKTSKQ
jgi:hypothetical protein